MGHSKKPNSLFNRAAHNLDWRGTGRTQYTPKMWRAFKCYLMPVGTRMVLACKLTKTVSVITGIGKGVLNGYWSINMVILSWHHLLGKTWQYVPRDFNPNFINKSNFCLKFGLVCLSLFRERQHWEWHGTRKVIFFTISLKIGQWVYFKLWEMKWYASVSRDKIRWPEPERLMASPQPEHCG